MLFPRWKKRLGFHGAKEEEEPAHMKFWWSRAYWFANLAENTHVFFFYFPAGSELVLVISLELRHYFFFFCYFHFSQVLMNTLKASPLRTTEEMCGLLSFGRKTLTADFSVLQRERIAVANAQVPLTIMEKMFRVVPKSNWRELDLLYELHALHRFFLSFFKHTAQPESLTPGVSAQRVQTGTVYY